LFSRASHPIAQSKTGVLPFSSILSCANDNSPSGAYEPGH
jgi:hypothetical protein